MSLQFGPTKIGGMQYNGVTIGEAMMDGQIVYRSVPPSIYPVSGTGSATMDFSFTGTIGSHTIAEPGLYAITHLVTGQGGAWGTSVIETPGGNAYGPSGNSSTSTLEVTLNPGDVVVFIAQNTDWGVQSYSGSWSIVKN